MIHVTKEWLKSWESVKPLLRPYGDLAEYFTKTKISGYQLNTIDVGLIKFPTGEFLVCDPMVFLTDRNEPPYLRKVPVGEYPLTIAVVKIEENHYRFAAARVLFTDKPVKKYEVAMKGREKFGEIIPGDTFYGFNVDAGLAAIADVETRNRYCDFCEKWEMQNPDGNIYDDYFEAYFVESYKEHPKYQRKGGDWINWTIPGTELLMPMFASGWGDGTYSVYFGLDENGEVCQLIVELISIEYMDDHDDDME